MRGLNQLTLGDYVFLFQHWSSADVTPLLQAKPLLSGWILSVAEVFEALSALPRQPNDINPDADANADANADDAETTPDTEVGEVKLRPLDQSTEASARVLRGGLRAGQDQALARNDAPDAARWRAAEAALFPQGLAFLKLSLPEQVGETVRLIERTHAKEVAWLKTRWRCHDQTFQDAVDTLTRNNKALNAALLAPALTPSPTQADEVSLTALRRRAQRLVSDMLPVIERAYPSDDASAAQTRSALLSPLQARVAARAALLALQKKRATVEPANTPTTPTE